MYSSVLAMALLPSADASALAAEAEAEAQLALAAAARQRQAAQMSLPAHAHPAAPALSPQPAAPSPVQYRWVRYGSGPWVLEAVSDPSIAPTNPPAPAVAGSGFPKPASSAGIVSGCGCQPGYNCGATFCKSRGGSGCPTSCPVKAR